MVLIYKIILQVQELEIKLNKLRGGVTLVRPEERAAVESTLSEKISQWRKRKRMFRDLWDTLTENSPKDPKEFKVSFCPVTNIAVIFYCYVLPTITTNIIEHCRRSLG
jgi:hypothetical protein